MRINTHVAFPYPVARLNSDDYLGESFETPTTVLVDNSNVNIDLEYRLSSTDIKRQIDNGNASYVSVITCRDTFFEKVSSSDQSYLSVDIDTHKLRGKVEIRSYVLTTRDFKLTSKKINDEFALTRNATRVDYFADQADKSFDYVAGDIIAVDSGNQFFVDKEYFKPLQSIFELVLNPKLESGEWEIYSDQDKLQINVAQNIFDLENDLRQNLAGKSVLLNSIWFAAVMHAVQLLKDNQAIANEYRWADVVHAKINLLGINLDRDDAYKIATKLLNHPLVGLETLFSEG